MTLIDKQFGAHFLGRHRNGPRLVVKHKQPLGIGIFYEKGSLFNDDGDAGIIEVKYHEVYLRLFTVEIGVHWYHSGFCK